jgi:hypothetical protein
LLFGIRMSNTLDHFDIPTNKIEIQISRQNANTAFL